MQVGIAPGVRLFVDIDGAALVPDGAALRAKPTLILLHGGPGHDHSGFKPLFSQLADIAQVGYVDHRGHGHSAGSSLAMARATPTHYYENDARNVIGSNRQWPSGRPRSSNRRGRRRNSNTR